MISAETRGKIDELLCALADYNEEQYGIDRKMSLIDKAMNIIDSLEELPLKVGDTVYVITNCKNIAYDVDDIGNVTCSIEEECPYFDEGCCGSKENRIFQSTVLEIYNNGTGWQLLIDKCLSPYFMSQLGVKFFKTEVEAETYLTMSPLSNLSEN